MVQAFSDSNPYAGSHVIFDLWGVDADKLTVCQEVQNTLEQAALEAKATVLFSHFHHFGEGYGLTGVIVLAESHISIHTWPERNFAAIDVFMCGNAEPLNTLNKIKEYFNPAHIETKVILRGESTSES